MAKTKGGGGANQNNQQSTANPNPAPQTAPANNPPAAQPSAPPPARSGGTAIEGLIFSLVESNLTAASAANTAAYARDRNATDMAKRFYDLMVAEALEERERRIRAALAAQRDREEAERAAAANLRTANAGLQGDLQMAKRNFTIYIVVAIVIIGLFIYFKTSTGDVAIQPVSTTSVVQPANVIPAPMPQPAAVTIKTALEYPYNQCLGGTQAKRRSEVEPCCNKIGEALGGQYGNNCLEIMRLLFVSPPPA